jgi:hypothetical protein
LVGLEVFGRSEALTDGISNGIGPAEIFHHKQNPENYLLTGKGFQHLYDRMLHVMKNGILWISPESCNWFYGSPGVQRFTAPVIRSAVEIASLRFDDAAR